MVENVKVKKPLVVEFFILLSRVADDETKFYEYFRTALSYDN